MANKLSKLQIDITKVEDWIQLWYEEKFEDSCTINVQESEERIKYEIGHNVGLIKLDLQRCAGGLFTICPNVGSNISLSKDLAECIYERVSNVQKVSPFANGFSIILSAGDFSALIDLINEIDGVNLVNHSEQLEQDKAMYKLFKFRGILGDTVTIKFYPRTSRMQMQGKPLALFNEIVAMVSDEGASLNDVVDAQIHYCNLDVRKEEILNELEIMLGKELFTFLSSAHKAILSTSIILSRIDGFLGDYSIIVQPANRTYEGFAKKIFTDRGLSLNGGEQLGKFFDWQDGITPIMKQEYAGLLDSEIVDGLTGIYKFYSKHRHPYSHATAYDFTTAIIEDRKEAERKLNEVVTSMKEWFAWHSNS